MKRILILLAALLVGGWGMALTASAQGTGDIAIDHVDARGAYGHDTLQAGQNVRFVLRFLNNTVEKDNISNGWKISTPDGATWDSVTMDSVGPFTLGEAAFPKLFDVIFSFQSGKIIGTGDSTFGGNGTNPDTVGVLGAGSPSKVAKQMPVGYNDTAMAIIIWFNGKAAENNQKHICIDTAFWGSGGTWVWVGQNPANSYFPTFTGEAGMVRVPMDTATQGPDGIGSGYCYLLFNTPVDVNETDAGSLPKVFSVSQNYPNPFNPTTKINFEVPRKSMVNLSVYNVLGQKVATLVDREMAPGKYVADWDASDNASGIYFFKFDAGTFSQTKKMVLMK